MPGVKITTSLRAGVANPLRRASGQYFVVGFADRGDVLNPVKINSMTDYARLLGDRVTYGTLFDDLTTFFAEGGTQAYVCRLAGPAATVGTITFSDGAGAPLPTIRFDATSPGAWSTRLSVQTVAGAVAGTFTLNVLFDGVVVEQYVNLLSPADAANRTASSNLIKVTDLGSVSASPLNNPTPAGPTSLTAGVDDRTNVTDTLRIAAVNARFAPELGDGAIASPGSSTTVIQAGLQLHAKNNNRVALLANPRGTLQANLLLNATSLSTNPGAEFSGLFAPWISVPDGSGGLRFISPEGYVAASRNKAHEQVGPWRAPAGEISRSSYVVGIDQTFDQINGDLLDAGKVSVIRNINSSVRLYGYRSLSVDEVNFALLNVKDLINYLSVELRRRLEPEVFATIDGRGQELSRMNGIAVGLLEPIRQAGGIFELRNPADNSVIDPGYSVDTSPSANPLSKLQNNIASVNAAVRPSPTAALINLAVIQVGLTAST